MSEPRVWRTALDSRAREHDERPAPDFREGFGEDARRYEIGLKLIETGLALPSWARALFWVRA